MTPGPRARRAGGRDIAGGCCALRLHVGVEVDESGLAQAWVREYLGCTSRGASQGEALERLPEALRAFWSWLRAHGEPDVPAQGAEVSLAEVEVCRVASRLWDADSEGFFSFDRLALTAEEFQRALRYMAYARSDVLALSDAADAATLGHGVGRSGRSVGATLSHLAFTDLWYAQRAAEPSSAQWRRHLLEELRASSLRWVEDGFRAGETPPVFTLPPDAWGEGREEAWTLPKALRRYVWHDLLHLRALRRALDDGP